MSQFSNARQPILVGLIVGSTLTFGLGILLERSVAGGSHTETALQASTKTPSEAAEGSGGETAAQTSTELGEGSSADPPASIQSAATHVEAGEQRILGINPESDGSVLAAMAASFALALGASQSRARALMLGIVAFGLLFAAFDIRDAIFQAQQSRFGLAGLAAIVALSHLSASALAAMIARANPSPISA